MGNSIFYRLWIVIIFMIITCLSSMALARMAPLKSFNFATYIATQDANTKGAVRTQEDQDLLLFSKFASEILGMESVAVYYRVSASTVRQAVDEQILELWDLKLADNKMKWLSQRKEELQKVAGDRSLTWAWIQTHLGDLKTSQSILLSVFDAEHSRILKMITIQSFSKRSRTDGGPRVSLLAKSKNVLKRIEPTLDPKQAALLKEKFRQMKVHVSRLPISKVKT